MKDTLLEVERPRRIKRKAVARVVRVGGVEPADERRLDVVPIVAIGVFEVDHARSLRHDHALPPEFKPDRVVEVAGERLHAVCFSVAVGVFEDEELVIHRFVGPPVRIHGPRCHPEPPLRVEAHLHRIDQLRKHPLIGDELHRHAGMDGHLADGIPPGEERVLAPLE